ncbi:MAG: ferrous iron transport protein A [Candidatus Cloacimonetes bacterium]|nr:ferrous iron transport protein A [Candidatus Cloacimonadota bacterium]
MNGKFFRRRHSNTPAEDNYGGRTVQSMKNGTSATIIEIQGGRNFIQKTESLGIRVGVLVTKVSSQMLEGPVTIRVGQTQIAIGHGAAKKVIVE